MGEKEVEGDQDHLKCSTVQGGDCVVSKIQNLSPLVQACKLQLVYYIKTFARPCCVTLTTIQVESCCKGFRNINIRSHKICSFCFDL